MSKNKYQHYIGMDVSKKTLDVCVRPSGEVFKVSNTLEGFKTLKTQFKLYSKALVVVESTGGYENAVVEFLQKHRKTVAVVNARQVRDFAKALGRLAKTDKVDAAVIAHFGEAVQPRAKALESRDKQDLKETQQRRAQLVTLLTMERNRLWKTSGLVKQSIEAVIQLLKEQLKAIPGSRYFSLNLLGLPVLKRSEKKATSMPSAACVCPASATAVAHSASLHVLSPLATTNGLTPCRYALYFV